MPQQRNSLVERLLLGRRGIAPSRRLTGADLLDSVLANLNRIFNCNQGSSLSRPDYGVPDFNQIIADFPEAVPRLTRLIEEQIRMFEPRLRACRVRFLDDSVERASSGPVSLNFAITAELADIDNEVIRFETVFAQGGKLHVRS